jgi:Ca2+-binding RTX toxin-like protein
VATFGLVIARVDGWTSQGAACLAAWVVVLAFAPAAWADTHVYVADGGFEEFPDVMMVTGDAGVNVISVMGPQVHDAAGPVIPGDRCVAVDDHTAQCYVFELVRLRAGEGDDVVTLETATPSYSDGGPGDDQLRSYAPNSLTFLAGGPGADRLHGGAGHADVANYEDHDAGAAVSLDGVANDGAPGEGDHVDSEIDVLLGGRGPDVLDLAATSAPPYAAFAAFGQAGDDRLLAGTGGQRRLVGGSGDDVMVGGSGADVLADEGCSPEPFPPLPDPGLCPGEGDDTLIGAGGADELRGQAGDDLLHGGPGDDLLAGGIGADDFQGGEGWDSAAAASGSLPVTVTVDDRADDGSDYDRHADNVHTDVEEVLGGYGSDTLFGSNGVDMLRGGPGNDVIDGLAGPDHLYGDDGDDSVRARDGVTDLVDCGDGADAVVADDIDETVASCEQRDIAGPPPTQLTPVTLAGPPPTQLTPVTPAGIDARAPTVEVSGLRKRIRRAKLLKRGIRVALTADEPVSFAVSLERTIRRARSAGAGDLILAAREVPLTSAPQRLRLRVPRGLRGFVPRRGGNLRLVLRARDHAGNATVLQRKVRLR